MYVCNGDTSSTWSSHNCARVQGTAGKGRHCLPHVSSKIKLIKWIAWICRVLGAAKRSISLCEASTTTFAASLYIFLCSLSLSSWKVYIETLHRQGSTKLAMIIKEDQVATYRKRSGQCYSRHSFYPTQTTVRWFGMTVVLVWFNV